MAKQQNLSARAQYRRKIQQRQTVVFGSIAAVLIMLLLLGILFWTGLVPFPFNRDFTQPPAAGRQIPCPPTSAQPADPEKITARVYNSSLTSGLAGEVSAGLAEAGVTIAETANWRSERLEPSATIFAGSNGVVSAYTLRSYFPDSIIQFDPTNDSAVVDVVIGNSWTDMNTAPTEEEFIQGMEPIEGCTAVEGLN